MAATDTTTMKKGTRIVATTALPGVPEGTPGKVGHAIGMALVRYRVAFDNGTEKTSVAHTKLVPEGEWETFREQRAKAAAEAAERKSNEGDAPKAEAKPDDGAGAPPVDDRLAALLAKSKAAKAKKLG